eukprot:88186_1
MSRSQLFLVYHFLVSMMWFLPSSVKAIGISVGTGNPRCISEDLDAQQSIEANYEVVQKGGIVFATVRSPSGDWVYKQRAATDLIKFTAKENGEHQFCFMGQGPNGAQLEVDVQINSGLSHKKYDELATKENLEPIEAELRMLEDTIGSIFDEMLLLRDREEVMRKTNESTNSRVLWFGVASMCVLVSLSTWQIYYLRRFFQKKKIL